MSEILKSMVDERKKEIQIPRGQLFDDSFVAVHLEGYNSKSSLTPTSFSGFTIEISEKVFLITCYH
jgi:hypothetical protein